ncbi:hypothetical protein H4R35_002015 [Dimargaris xerosporica]|nr:hypothetical protein H4R35_002015 [Dimargaris xerosporica]
MNTSVPQPTGTTTSSGPSVASAPSPHAGSVVLAGSPRSEEAGPDRGLRLTHTPGADSPSSAGPRKSRQIQACEYCRQKKIRCDSDKPACGNCKKRNLTCNYTSTQTKRAPRQGYIEKLEKRLDDMERLIEPLKPLPSPTKRRRTESSSHTSSASAPSLRGELSSPEARGELTPDRRRPLPLAVSSSSGGGPYLPPVVSAGMARHRSAVLPPLRASSAMTNPVTPQSPSFAVLTSPPAPYLAAVHSTRSQATNGSLPKLSAVLSPGAHGSSSDSNGDKPGGRRLDPRAMDTGAPLGPAETVAGNECPPNSALSYEENFCVTYFMDHLATGIPVLHPATIRRHLHNHSLYRPLLHSICALVCFVTRRIPAHPLGAAALSWANTYAERVRAVIMEHCNYPSVELLQTLVIFGYAEYARGHLVPSNMYMDMAIRIARTLHILRRDQEQKVHAKESAQSPSQLADQPGSVHRLDKEIQTEALRRAWWICIIVDRLESLTFGHRPKIYGEENEVHLPCHSQDWDSDCFQSPQSEVSLREALGAHHLYEGSLFNFLLRLITIAERVAHYRIDVRLGRITRISHAHPQHQLIETLMDAWEAKFYRLFLGGQNPALRDDLTTSIGVFVLYSAVRIIFYRIYCETALSAAGLAPDSAASGAGATASRDSSRHSLEASKASWSQCLSCAAHTADILKKYGHQLVPTRLPSYFGFGLWHSGTVLLYQRARSTRADEQSALQADVDVHYHYLHLFTDVWHCDFMDRMRQLDRSLFPSPSPHRAGHAPADLSSSTSLTSPSTLHASHPTHSAMTPLPQGKPLGHATSPHAELAVTTASSSVMTTR